jgi:hypothetical protein
MVALQANKAVGESGLRPHEKIDNFLAIPTSIYVVPEEHKTRFSVAAMRVTITEQRDELIETPVNISDCVCDCLGHGWPVRLTHEPMFDLQSTTIFFRKSVF